jgi:hypothetical protein
VQVLVRRCCAGALVRWCAGAQVIRCAGARVRGSPAPLGRWLVAVEQESRCLACRGSRACLRVLGLRCRVALVRRSLPGGVACNLRQHRAVGDSFLEVFNADRRLRGAELLNLHFGDVAVGPTRCRVGRRLLHLEAICERCVVLSLLCSPRGQRLVVLDTQFCQGLCWVKRYIFAQLMCAGLVCAGLCAGSHTSGENLDDPSTLSGKPRSTRSLAGDDRSTSATAPPACLPYRSVTCASTWRM